MFWPCTERSLYLLGHSFLGCLSLVVRFLLDSNSNYLDRRVRRLKVFKMEIKKGKHLDEVGNNNSDNYSRTHCDKRLENFRLK